MASDPNDPYRAATTGVTQHLITLATNVYMTVAPGPYQQAIAQFLQIMIPHLLAGQKSVANLTSAHLAQRTGTRALAVGSDVIDSRPIDITREYARPFITRQKALADGKTLQEADDAGAQRLSTLITTDNQMAKVRQSRASLDHAGATHYRRIAEGDNPCELCLLASTQVYNVEDLMPIHDNCECDVDVMEPGFNRRDIEIPDEMLFKADGSERNTKFTQYLKGIADQKAALPDAYRQLVEVQQHGELGPMLSWKGVDIGAPPKGLANRPVVTRGGELKTLAVQRPQELVDAWASLRPGFELQGFAENFHPVNVAQERGTTLMVRDYLKGVDAMLTKYPELARNPFPIQWDNMLNGSHAAETWRGPLWGTTKKMTLNPVAFSDVQYMRESVREAKGLLEGGSNKFGRIQPNTVYKTGEPWGYTAGIHEMGHVVSNLTSGQLETEIQPILQREFESRVGHLFNPATDNREMNQWLDTQMSSYAVGGMGWRGVYEGEAIAEAFADVEANGARATDLSKAIHRALINSTPKLKTSVADLEDLLQPAGHLVAAVPPPMLASLEDDIYTSVRENGGVTIDVSGNRPQEGFAYAPFKGTEVAVPEAEWTTQHLDDFLDARADELAQPGNHLGIWTYEGKVYMDVSKVGPATAETLATAQAADQLAVFDLHNFNDVDLGTIKDGRYVPNGSADDLAAQYRRQVEGTDQIRGAASTLEVSGREPAGAGGVTQAVAHEPLNYNGFRYGYDDQTGIYYKYSPTGGLSATPLPVEAQPTDSMRAKAEALLKGGLQWDAKGIAEGQDWQYRIEKTKKKGKVNLYHRGGSEDWTKIGNEVSTKDAKDLARRWEVSDNPPKGWVPKPGQESLVPPVGPVPAGAREMSQAKTLKDVEDILKERHPTLQTSGFGPDEWGGKPNAKMVREFFSGVDDQLTRYPGVRLQSVTIGNAQGGAWAETASTRKLHAQGVTERITLDSWTASDPYRYKEDWARAVKPEKWSLDKYGNQFPSKTPLFDAGVHEMGHTLNNSLAGELEDGIDDVLKDTFWTLHADDFKGLDLSPKEYAAKYSDWLRDNLPGYASVRGESFDAGETLAVSWADSRSRMEMSESSAAVQDWMEKKTASLRTVEKPAAAKPPAKKAIEKKAVPKTPPKKGVNQRPAVPPKKATTRNLEGRSVSGRPLPKTDGPTPASLRTPPETPTPSASYVMDAMTTEPLTMKRFGVTDVAETVQPVPKIKKDGSFRMTPSGKPVIDWPATWRKVPAIQVDLEGRVVDPVLDANFRKVLSQAPSWAKEAGATWYPEYGDFVRHELELAGRTDLTFEEAMNASGAFAINAGWNETMANFHNWINDKFPVVWDKRFGQANEAAKDLAYWEGGGAPKINDFTKNGAGDYGRSTTDRWMARIGLGTDDTDLAGGLLGMKSVAGSYVDAEGNLVTLTGYQRLAESAARVAREAGLDPAMAQATMWIEFLGPEAAMGLPPDEVVAGGLEALNQWTKYQAKLAMPEGELTHVPFAEKKPPTIPKLVLAKPRKG